MDDLPPSTALFFAYGSKYLHKLDGSVVYYGMSTDSGDAHFYELNPFVSPTHASIALEMAAKLIYESWNGLPGYVAWQSGGNSHKQTEARDLAFKVANLLHKRS